MPLSRYQIRNEYALADSELYRAADTDDQEALLEGVAMAGLVGILRQLGDLAEFAGEIFHDLHEEVMATAARGHGLMARVRQLEAEFPSIERAFLSQTNHSSFFSNAGVDWHPNLRTEQNLITSGDMPRFVMDSYEECRSPPRLFHLDKYDVAGAGACLKRYTDPSFFKIEPLSSEIARVDTPREKKNRKIKKKGSCWRNGETPEVAPASHAKLHQLFLEERIENAHSDPARIVRLKRRQLNGFLLDLKPGKSYMENFLETSSPEHKEICDVSVIPPAFQLTYDNSSESGLEILEISTVSPVKMPSQGRESSFSSPDAQKVVVKPFTGELNGEAIDRAIVKAPDPMADGETDESCSTVHKMEIEKRLLINTDRSTEVSVDGDHSDGVASEVDNYMDALPTMESEMETENEYKTKQYQGPLNVGKYGTDSEANDEQLDDQANCSDSPSVGISSLSDDGNSLSKKGRSSFSRSDYSRNPAKIMLSNDGVDEVFPSAGVSFVEIVGDHQSSHRSAYVDSLGVDYSEIVVSNDFCPEESNIPDIGKASCSPQLADSNMVLPAAAATASSLVVSVGPDTNETPSHSIKHHLGSPDSNENEMYTADSSVVFPEVVSQTRQETLYPVSSQTNPLDGFGHEDPDVLSDANVHQANALEMASENKGGGDLVNEVLKTDDSDETSVGNLAEEELFSPELIVPSAEEQLTCSALPGNELDSSAILLPNNSGSILPVALDSEDSDIRVDLLPVEHDLPSRGATITASKHINDEEVVVPSSENLKLEEISPEKDGESSGGFTIKVDAVLFEHPSDGSDEPGCVDLVNCDDVASKTDKAENVALSTAAGAGGANDNGANDTGCLSSNVNCSPYANITGIQESRLISKDAFQKPLDLNEMISLGHLTDLEAQKRVQQVKLSPTDSNSSPHISGSSNQCNREVIFVEDDSDAIISPTCHLPETSSLEQQALELPPFQVDAEYLHGVVDETNSKSSNLPAPPTGYLEELGSPLEHLNQLQPDQPDRVCVQENEASSFPFNVQVEQMQTADNLCSEKCLDASSKSLLEGVPSQEILTKLVGQELHGCKTVRNSLDSAFPSLSLFPEAAHVNLDELPPLPPLPPMQWRLGKVLTTQQILERQQVPVIQDTLPPMQLSTSQEKAELEISSSDSLIWGPSSPSLPIYVADSQRSQLHVSKESMKHSLEQALPCLEKVSSPNEATSDEESIPIDGKQSLNHLLNLPDMPSMKPEHDFPSLNSDSLQLSSNRPCQVPNIEQTTSGHDPVSLVVPLIHPLSHLESGTNVETRLTSEIFVGEQGNSPEKSVLPVTLLEEQSQCEVAPQGERTWPPTLALPPNYEVGKPNGNKLPRPRNPLIDAVAAHDKSKLRKVTERVLLQIEPKLDERDSLLEQIRSKSFNLKPATVTRSTIQAWQGPQTNLNVAAMLEKANSIRQALAGSDEDDDSDSWCDN